MKPPIPVLRIFDVEKAREFYVGLLGFKIDWKHRFAEGMPLYLQVSRGDCVIHLSEHHGDAAPGARLRIEVSDLDRFIESLIAAKSPFVRPDMPERKPWGLRETEVTDPFFNRLTFYEE